MKIFTFFKFNQDSEDIDSDQDSVHIDTATVLAVHLNEALELVRKQFMPEAYHEIDLQTVVDLKSHYHFVKYPKPIMLRNNDDLKDLS